MTARSLFFGRCIFERILWRQAIPIPIMLVVLPFVDPSGPKHELAVGLCQGGVWSAFSVFALYLLFGLLSGESWSPSHAADTAKVITLWLMAGVTVAYLF